MVYTTYFKSYNKATTYSALKKNIKHTYTIDFIKIFMPFLKKLSKKANTRLEVNKGCLFVFEDPDPI